MGLLADMGGPGIHLDRATDGTDIKLNQDEVNAVIRTTRAKARNLNSQKFRSLKVTGAAFSGYAGAQVVVATHGSAHAVTQETIDGVKQDLMDFAEQLELAVGSVTGVDELSATSLDKLAEVTPTDHGMLKHQGAVSEAGFQTNDESSSETEPNASLPAHGTPEDGA